MTKEKKQAYSLRISQANQSELTVITFEMFLDYINDATNCHDINDEKEYKVYIGKAKAILSEIMAALNFENKVSFDLIKIYEYVYGELVKMSYKADRSLLDRIKGIMEKLLAAHEEVAKNDKRGAVMENSQQLYAGLTYGKGYLNETCQGDGESWRA